MEELMSLRLPMTIIAALITAAGVTASAYSLTLGEIDQAIAFGWPPLAVALLIVLAMPSRHGHHSGTAS